MDYFGLGVTAGVFILSYLVYKIYSDGGGGDSVIVCYSEVIGNTILEHSKNYTGILNEKKDILHIKKLNLKRPIPPKRAMISTKGGNKKLYLIKIDQGRYGFRIPSLHNQILMYKRDAKDNLVLNDKGKPIIVKHHWDFCDDVVEPDVKHWEENIEEAIRRRHRTKKDAFEKWIGPVSMAMIFLLAVILNSQSSREVRLDKMMIMEKAEQMEKDAKETQQGLNSLLQKVTGQEILPTEKPDVDDNDAKKG